MRGSMLTEDIDSSMRTVERGLKIRSDRDVVSRELATTTFQQVWNQRLRWAQGWFQVTMMHTLRVWRSPGLTFRQKFGASYLLGYREIYPWLSLQIFPLVAYWLTRGDTLTYGWPIFLCTTLFVLHIGPIQTWYAYRLADWEIKQHKSWFVAYLLFSTLFYTEYKNTIARVAHVKEFVGERAWKVTPRGDAPIEFEDDDHDHDVGDQVERVDVPKAGGSGESGLGGSSHDRPHEAVGVSAPSVTAGGLPKRSRTADQRAAPIAEPVHTTVDGLPRRVPSTATTDAGLPLRSRQGPFDGGESGRLARLTAGLISPDGSTAQRRGHGAASPARLPSAARLDETSISARVRELAQRPLPRRAHAAPHIDHEASRRDTDAPT
jgi:hypothetical protein